MVREKKVRADRAKELLEEMMEKRNDREI